MDVLNLKIQELEQENVLLKQQLQETQERLKKYTFTDSNKKYKERNKEKINAYAKEYYQKKKLLKENNN